MLAQPVAQTGRRVEELAAQLHGRVQELESQRTQAQTILESMVEGVWALDRDGNVLWLNSSAQRLLGVSAPQAQGRRITELFRQPDLDAIVQEALQQRRQAIREIHTFGPQEHVVRFQATPCEGDATGAAVVLVAQDVTEMRRLEGIRREFVANVSHELKTPLTSIKSLVDTLLNGALQDSANNQRFVSLIDEETTRLTRLIDDLLALSQIESKAVPLRLEAVNLQALIEHLAARFQPQLEEHRVMLDVAFPPNSPSVSGDPDRLQQVFVNLLDNAIKFNAPGGRVTVRARYSGSSVAVSIEDTGIGIPEQDLPRIFERFYRVDKARSRELGGTGLGLSIVKHLVDLHQGTVSAQSRVGDGTVFTVTLPLA